LSVAREKLSRELESQKKFDELMGQLTKEESSLKQKESLLL